MPHMPQSGQTKVAMMMVNGREMYKQRSKLIKIELNTVVAKGQKLFGKAA